MTSTSILDESVTRRRMSRDARNGSRLFMGRGLGSSRLSLLEAVFEELSHLQFNKLDGTDGIQQRSRGRPWGAWRKRWKGRIRRDKRERRVQGRTCTCPD
jgi:hypothetical protein